MDGLGEKHPIDAARAGPGDNVGQHPKPKRVLRLNMAEKFQIDPLHPLRRRRGMVVISPAGARQLPQFLGDAMHVNGKADAAITHKRNAEFLLAHAQVVADFVGMGRGLKV